MPSDAKLHPMPSVGSCVEPLSDGVVGAWWASDVVQCPCVLLELLGLPVVSWWVMSCDMAAALGGLEATFHWVPVGREGAGQGFRLVGITTC